jgi:hypothetical protein
MGDTLHEAIATEIERQMRLNLRVEMCVVVATQRHAFEDDLLTNTVTVKIRDNIGYYTPCAQIDRQRVFQIQDYMGHHYGHPTHPRVGDLLWVLFYQNEKAIILGPCPSWEQLPVCRQHDDDQVYKYCQHELPTAVDQCGDITGQFPEPHWPVCWKFFGKDRCSLTVSECPLGEATPSCEVCKDLDDITNYSKSFKWYSSTHPSHPDRVRWSHKKGQFIQMERDGSILIRDSTGSFICLKGDEGGILIKDKAGSYIALNGEGNLTVRAAVAGSHNLHNTCCACPECSGGCPDAEDDMGGICTAPHYSDDVPSNLEPEVPAPGQN